MPTRGLRSGSCLDYKSCWVLLVLWKLTLIVVTVANIFLPNLLEVTPSNREKGSTNLRPVVPRQLPFKPIQGELTELCNQIQFQFEPILEGILESSVTEIFHWIFLSWTFLSNNLIFAIAKFSSTFASNPWWKCWWGEKRQNFWKFFSKQLSQTFLHL